jgi:TOMM system kinase/cyclase fusion protein
LTDLARPWHARESSGGSAVTFEEILDQALAMLQRRGRVTYRTLQRQFNLDDAALEDLKEALLYAHPHVADDPGHGLRCRGETTSTPPLVAAASQPAARLAAEDLHSTQTEPSLSGPRTADAERRQLTVLFCDLVDSTVLASQLDPEELREVVRAYQDTCAKVIARFEGHTAQYLGDGLLVYFGYPYAHEDDAQRAVRAGLGMVEAIGQLNTRLGREGDVQLAVRLGIHTGLVVVGEVGGGGRQEQLALGETPNVAARLQGIAAPNTLVISAATSQLLGGFFACQSLGTLLLKGVAQPLEVYQVLYENTARSRLEAAGRIGLTPLVGREQEVGLLLERWAQVTEGLGQVVLLSGEAGIGKSRLVQVLTEQVATEPQAWLIPCQCSPYHQNTALYPLIDLLERVTLRLEREESPEQKLRKLEGLVVQYGLPLAEAVPLFATLLSLPLSADYPPLTTSPEQQKQKTLHALLTILLRIAAQQPVLFVLEDLHWVDPTTLELLTLLVDQGPTARILALWTFRPDFSPPWSGRSHLTQMTLNRLPRRQAAELTGRMAHGKALPPEVVEQVVAKTDGVPLFVEELTKMVLESGLLQEREARYELTGPLPPLAIPATLHDSLMARLDRLAAVKAMAQLGATLGREFSYELLQAVAPWDEGTLQRGLQQLVEAEFLYQQGLPPQATYTFKHALIQDAAYQSLLRSTRQRYHQQIARVLETRFPETAETQPELVAHHYTEAGLNAQAIPYWQRAGHHASDRSANMEAISHLSTGIELLQTLPETPERTQQALTLHIALGAALQIAKGHAAPEVEHTYTRARALCQQVGETPELVPVLFGLWRFYVLRPALHTARELGETMLRLAQRTDDPTLAVMAHWALGLTWLWLGALPVARQHLEEAIARYTPDQRRVIVSRVGNEPGVPCRLYVAMILWLLGYPAQALARLQKALALPHELSHPFSLAVGRCLAATASQFRRDVPAAHEHAEAAVALATEHGIPQWAAYGTSLRGWALALQGQGEEGLAQIRQGIAAWRATGAAVFVPYLHTLLADVSAHLGRTEDGLQALAEAHTLVEQHKERYWEAEVARLRGVLLLRQTGTWLAEAEAWLRRALDVARRQQAKGLELRAAMSLARLWQQQGKCAEANDLLTPIYGWFTEGFDTPDLQEAKALLDALKGEP